MVTVSLGNDEFVQEHIKGHTAQGAGLGTDLGVRVVQMGCKDRQDRTGFEGKNHDGMMSDSWEQADNSWEELEVLLGFWDPSGSTSGCLFEVNCIFLSVKRELSP